MCSVSCPGALFYIFKIAEVKVEKCRSLSGDKKHLRRYVLRRDLKDEKEVEFSYTLGDLFDSFRYSFFRVPR